MRQPIGWKMLLITTRLVKFGSPSTNLLAAEYVSYAPLVATKMSSEIRQDVALDWSELNCGYCVSATA